MLCGIMRGPRRFCQVGAGGDGGPGPPDRKKAPLSEFFAVFILSLSSIF